MITLKTPFENIEILKKDYESEKVRFKAPHNANILMVLLEGKQIILTLTEFSITSYSK